MELVFIRHGQGLHNTNIPDRLNVLHPPLTDKGISQVLKLREAFAFTPQDLFIASPTRRTIQTTNLLTDELALPRKWISPAVGPRMFPMPESPELHAVRCDIALPLAEIERECNGYRLMGASDAGLWAQGINTMPETEFKQAAAELLKRLRAQGAGRAFIVSHDGTITSYRQLLGEQGLTRRHFLGEAGYYAMELPD